MGECVPTTACEHTQRLHYQVGRGTNALLFLGTVAVLGSTLDQGTHIYLITDLQLIGTIQALTSNYKGFTDAFF